MVQPAPSPNGNGGRRPGPAVVRPIRIRFPPLKPDQADPASDQRPASGGGHSGGPELADEGVVLTPPPIGGSADGPVQIRDCSPQPTLQAKGTLFQGLSSLHLTAWKLNGKNGSTLGSPSLSLTQPSPQFFQLGL